MSQSQKWWSMGLLPLREELRSKGLETHGSKPVLVRRLEVYEERLNALRSRSTPVQLHKSPVKGESNTNSDGSVKGRETNIQTEQPEPDKSTVVDSNTQQAPIEKKEDDKPKDWWTLSMQELKNECSKRNLSFMGNKYTLVNRLKGYDSQQTSKPAAAVAPSVKTSAPPTASVPVSNTTPSKTNTVPSQKTPDPKPSATPPPRTNTVTPQKAPITKPTATPARTDTVALQKDPVTKPTTTPPGTDTVAPQKGPIAKPTTAPPPKIGTVTPQKGPDTKVTPPPPSSQKQASPSPGKEASDVNKTTELSATVKAEIERICKLTLAQLKIECVNKKLNISGSRTELLERLKQHVIKAESVNKETGSMSKPAAAVVNPIVSSSPVGKVPSGRPMIAIQTPTVTSIKGSSTAVKWSPVAQKTTPAVLPAQPQVEVTPVKKVITASVGVQTVQTMEVDRPQPVKIFYAEEQVELAKKFSSKPPFWEDKTGKFPDAFLEYIPAREIERKARSLLIYPVTYKDIQDPDFNRVRQTARSCVINFRDHTSLNRALKGSVELEFFTRKACQNAEEHLKKWHKDLKLEKLSQNTSLDAALVKLGMKAAKLEPTANRLLFLNKLPMKLKEGALAEKFSDAASICIAKDTLNVSKGYGFVEYGSSGDAQAAYNRNKNLYLEGTRIDVTLYPKVPANLEEDKHRLVMPDCERVKLSEKHHQTTLDFNKAKSGPYNRDRTNDQSLLKEMSVLEEKLAVDAAIRKKLEYSSLPEPVGFMSTEMRKAWQTGDFSSFKVDLGGIHKDWGESKIKPIVKMDEKLTPGPTPAKVSKMDNSAKSSDGSVKREEKMATSLAATLSQLKENEVDDRKRKEPLIPQQSKWNKADNYPQKATGSWQQKQDNNSSQRNTWNQQKQDNRSQPNTWGQQKQDSISRPNTWNQPKSDNKSQPNTWNQQKDSFNQNTGGGQGWNQRSDSQGGMKAGRSMASGFGESKTSTYEGKNMATTDNRPSRFGNQQNRFDRKESDFEENLPAQFGRQSQPSSFSNTDSELRNKKSFGDNQSSRFGENQTSRFGSSPTSRFGDNQPSRFGDSEGSHFEDNQASRFGDNQKSRFGDNQFSRFGDKQASKIGDNQTSRFGDNQPSRFKNTRFGENQSTQFGSKSGQQQFQDSQDEEFEENRGPNLGKFQGIGIGGTTESSWGRGKRSGMGGNESFQREAFGRGGGLMGQDSEQRDNRPETLGRGRGSFGRQMPSAGSSEDFRGVGKAPMGRGKQTQGQEGEKPRFNVPTENKDVYAKFYGGEDVSDVITRESFPMSFSSTKKSDIPESTEEQFGGEGMHSGNRFGMQGRHPSHMEAMDVEDEEDNSRQGSAFGQKAFGRGSFHFGQQRGGTSQIRKGFGRGTVQKEDEDDYNEDVEEQMSFGRGSNQGTRFGRGSNRGNFRQSGSDRSFSQFGKQGGNKNRFQDDVDEETEFGGVQNTVNQKNNFGNFGRNQRYQEESQGFNKNKVGLQQNQGSFNQSKQKPGFGNTDMLTESATSFGQGGNRGSLGGESTKGQSNFGQSRQSKFGQRQNRFDKGGRSTQFMAEQEEEEEGQGFNYRGQSRGFQAQLSSKGQEDSLFESNPEGFRRTPGAGARATASQEKQYGNPMDTPKSQFGSGMNTRQEPGRFSSPQDNQNQQDFASSGGFNRQQRGGSGAAHTKVPPPSLLGRPSSQHNKESASQSSAHISSQASAPDTGVRNQSGQAQLSATQPPADPELPPLPQQPQQPPPQPTQPPPQQPAVPGYPEYDQKAYEEYYRQYGYDYSQAGYDYSQYGYGPYGQAAQGDWTQGYWGYPFSQPPPPVSKPSDGASQTQQPAATDKTGQWDSYAYGQQPATSQQSAATTTPTSGGAPPAWSNTTQGDQSQGAEETVNTELVKKLGPAVSTLRQQMQYETKEKKVDSSNMPTFVSNMASYSSTKTQGFGSQYGAYQ